jgi:hypothetical protein
LKILKFANNMFDTNHSCRTAGAHAIATSSAVSRFQNRDWGAREPIAMEPWSAETWWQLNIEHPRESNNLWGLES